MITVLASGPMITVQDLGRPGYRASGVGLAGAMDPLALKLGNLLLGNEQGAAGIEIAASGLSIRFERNMAFAITGGDCAARLGGRPLPPWWTMRGRKGEVLTLHPPRDASFAYLAIAGGFSVEPVFGSASTDLKGRFGGMEGRALKPDDLLRVNTTANPAPAMAGPEAGFGLSPRLLEKTPHEPASLRIVTAAEYGALTTASRDAFWESSWRLDRDSSRVGYRLGGPELQLDTPMELFSHGILPGVVQLPPSGQPVVQMVDGNTCGGYPRLGVIIAADLRRLAQLKPGGMVRFVEVSQREALAIAHEEEAFLLKVAHFVSLAAMRPKP